MFGLQPYVPYNPGFQNHYTFLSAKEQPSPLASYRSHIT